MRVPESDICQARVLISPRPRSYHLPWGGAFCFPDRFGLARPFVRETLGHWGNQARGGTRLHDMAGDAIERLDSKFRPPPTLRVAEYIDRLQGFRFTTTKAR
jgi:hypothetical protein